jgi:hypothetical protein
MLRVACRLEGYMKGEEYTYLIPLLLTHTIQILPLAESCPSLFNYLNISSFVHKQLLNLPLRLFLSKRNPVKTITHTAFAKMISNPPNPSIASCTARFASAVLVISFTY